MIPRVRAIACLKPLVFLRKLVARTLPRSRTKNKKHIPLNAASGAGLGVLQHFSDTASSCPRAPSHAAACSCLRRPAATAFQMQRRGLTGGDENPRRAGGERACRGGVWCEVEWRCVLCVLCVGVVVVCYVCVIVCVCVCRLSVWRVCVCVCDSAMCVCLV
jgi:hypothetical protein